MLDLAVLSGPGNDAEIPEPAAKEPPGLWGQPGLEVPQPGSPEERGTGSPWEALGSGMLLQGGSQCLTLLKGGGTCCIATAAPPGSPKLRDRRLLLIFLLCICGSNDQQVFAIFQDSSGTVI